MAGLTSTSSSFTTLTPISSKPLTSKPLFLPSLNSSLFGLTFHLPHLRSSSSFPLIYYATTVSARYGGGGGRGNFRPPPRSDDDEALDISSIRSAQVRLIDDKQNMLGIVSKIEAIQRAEDAELDLVILSPEADPPVVKMMDYNATHLFMREVCAKVASSVGFVPEILIDMERHYRILVSRASKYKYELQKKKKEQQKKSAASRMDLKELKMGYNIDSHDYSVRLRAAQKFLKDGDKVKIIVNLKGRENEFRNNAIELLKRFQTDIGELASEENKNFRDRNMFIVLVPNKAVVQKGPEPPKKKDKSATEVSASV